MGLHTKCKVKIMKRGAGTLLMPSNTNSPSVMASNTGGAKEGICESNETDASPIISVAATPLSETESARKISPETENKKNVASASSLDAEGKCNLASVSLPETETACSVSSASLLESGSTNWPATASSNKNEMIVTATIDLNQSTDPSEEINVDAQIGANPSNA